MNELRLSKGDVGASGMKTTVMSPEENNVAMNLDEEKKRKEELKKKKAKEESLKLKSKETNLVKDVKVVVRDPLQLLKLF